MSGIADYLVVCGNMPVSMVEQPWFKNFMKVVDPKFRVPTRYTFSSHIKSSFSSKQSKLKALLVETKWVSCTLDMWSDRRMRSYMGITVHLLSADLQLNSYLLDFSYFTGSHTAENIVDHCTTVFEQYQLLGKVCFAVTDNAANMQKAFKIGKEIFADLVEDKSDVDESTEVVDDTNAVADEENTHLGSTGANFEINPNLPPTENQSDADVVRNETLQLLDEAIEDWYVADDLRDNVLSGLGNITRQRLPCAIHTLQLTVLDGLRSAKFLGSIQAKASRLSTLLHTSGTFQEKFFALFKNTIPRTTNTRWNSMYLQFAAIAKLDAIKLASLTSSTKNDACLFTTREFKTLKEAVAVLEPAYEATLVLEEEKALLSTVGPTITELHTKWTDMNDSLLFCEPLLRSLVESLQARFDGLLQNVGILGQSASTTSAQTNSHGNFGDSAYIVSAALDPEFGTHWLDETLEPSVTGKFRFFNINLVVVHALLLRARYCYNPRVYVCKRGVA